MVITPPKGVAIVHTMDVFYSNHGYPSVLVISINQNLTLIIFL